MTDNKPSGAMLLDCPISTANDDQLARDPLVRVVAGYILTKEIHQSAVIALNAPWGAGKSSFLNLLEERLKTGGEGDGGGEDLPIIVRFNPWYYDSVEQLAQMYFAELAAGIGKSGSAKKRINEIGAWLYDIGALVSESGSVLGPILKGVGTATAKGTRGRTLPEMKAKLDELLSRLNRRVVVFVDDVDRLERDALRMMFRVVRLIADFSNVTYVLAFDRSVVEKNLDEENGIRGRDYLEKIVQVAVDIPAPERVVISEILVKELNEIVASVPTKAVDDDRFWEADRRGFGDHFRTIRQVKRYANAVKFTLPTVAKDVDLADFLVVELFRVFHPEVYHGLAHGKDWLAPGVFARAKQHASTLGRQSDTSQDLKEWVADLCKKASPGFEERVRDLLRILFPILSRSEGRIFARWVDDPESRKLGRICSPDAFDKYFLLAVPQGDVSDVEVQAFVNGLADVEGTGDLLRRAPASRQTARLLERVLDYVEDLQIPQIETLLDVMFDLGDELHVSLPVIGFSPIVPTVVYQCIKCRTTEEERFNLLLPFVPRAKALGTLICLVDSVLPAPPTQQPGLLSNQDWCDKLRTLAVTRIRQGANSGDLWVVPELPVVLYRWRQWTTEEEVRAKVREYTSAEDNFVHLVQQLVSTVWSNAGRGRSMRAYPVLMKEVVADFFDLDRVLERLKQIRSGSSKNAAKAGELVDLIEAGPKLTAP